MQLDLIPLRTGLNRAIYAYLCHLASVLPLAWAAGVVDGEGCLHIARQTYRDPRRRARPTYVFRPTVAQSDHHLLHHLHGVIGEHGYIHMRKRQRNMNKQPYVLDYSGPHAYAALRKLHPYLIGKRPEADVVFDFEREGRIHQRLGPGGQDAGIWEIRRRYYKKLQRMK